MTEDSSNFYEIFNKSKIEILQSLSSTQSESLEDNKTKLDGSSSIDLGKIRQQYEDLNSKYLEFQGNFSAYDSRQYLNVKSQI